MASLFDPPDTVTVAYVSILGGLKIDTEHEIDVEVESPVGEITSHPTDTIVQTDPSHHCFCPHMLDVDVSVPGFYRFRTFIDGVIVDETAVFVERLALAPGTSMIVESMERGVSSDHDKLPERSKAIPRGPASIADDFISKAGANAAFVEKGLPALDYENDFSWEGLFLPFQPAYQLTLEGIELLLKAMILRGGKRPRDTHKLGALYSRLDTDDRMIVDTVVQEAIAGDAKYGLPNLSAVTLRKDFILGADEAEHDHTAGFSDMDALASFKMLDFEWGPTMSQYLGVTRAFDVDRQTMRVDTRILAAALTVCYDLADRLRAGTD